MRYGKIKASNGYTLPVVDGSASQLIKTDGSAACGWLTASGVNVGTMLIWPTATAPTGWVLCDGTAYARAGTYAALFAVISTTYGAPDGGNFNVPDMRGRVAVGLSADTEFDNLGETGGEKTHTLTEAEMAAHTHSSPSAAGSIISTGSGSAGKASTSSSGSGSDHNNLQPYMALNFIIKY